LDSDTSGAKSRRDGLVIEDQAGGPPPRPLPAGANIEALKAYREIAIQIIKMNKDTVKTPAMRVKEIDKALGR